MLGVFFVLLSASLFSVNSLMSRRGLALGTASAGAFVTVMVGVPLFLAASVVSGQLFHADEVGLQAYVLLSLGGILHFGVGRYCNYRAVSAIGATRTGPVQAFTVPFAVLFAFVFLGETINVLMAVAIALILVGPAVMVESRSSFARSAARLEERSSPRGASGTGPAPAFQLRQTEGYLFGALSVGAYATSPILIRSALEDATDLAVFGGFVATLAAAVALAVALVHPARRGVLSAMNRGTLRLFFGAGVFVFLAQMFRFIALSLAPVTLITPLMRSTAVFTLIGSWAINRHLELITWRVVAGIAVSVGGATMLVIVRV